MGQISVTQTTQTTHITQVKVQETQVRQREMPVAPPDPSPEMARDILNLPPQNHGSAQAEVKLPPEPPKPTSAPRIIKNIAGGALLGGSASAIVNMAGKSMAYSKFVKPSGAWTGAGVALGTGLALASIETDNKALAGAKDLAAGGLIGGGAMAMASSIGRSMIQNSGGASFGPSASGTAAAAALGVGLAALKMDTGSKAGNMVKDLAAGAAIGGSGMAIASGLLKATTKYSAYEAALVKPSPTAIVLGIAAGAGIAILASKDD